MGDTMFFPKQKDLLAPCPDVSSLWQLDRGHLSFITSLHIQEKESLHIYSNGTPGYSTSDTPLDSFTDT